MVWLQFIELVGWANVTPLFVTQFPASSRVSWYSPSSPWLFSIQFPVFSKQKRLKKIVTGYWIGCYSSLHRKVFFHRPLSMCCMPNLIDKWCLEREIVQKGIKISWFIKSDCKTKVKKFSGPISSSLVQGDDPVCVETHTVSSLPLERWA